MRNIEMNYYNVYYYCNIIDNLLNLFTTSIEWVVTGAQFTEPFFESEEEIECFPKYSALHAFCEFAIRQLMFEDAEEQITDIQRRYDELEIDNKAKRLSAAFRGEEKDDCFLEVDRLFKTYGKKHESFFSYLVENDFDNIIDAYDDFTRFDGDLDDAILHMSRELFFILFQNREFLFRFNTYMANANPKKAKRCNIPQWVKRAVKYRDRGKCVCCGKDLSGLLDCEDEASVHYDPMHYVCVEYMLWRTTTSMAINCAFPAPFPRHRELSPIPVCRCLISISTIPICRSISDITFQTAECLIGEFRDQ